MATLKFGGGFVTELAVLAETLSYEETIVANITDVIKSEITPSFIDRAVTHSLHCNIVSFLFKKSFLKVVYIS